MESAGFIIVVVEQIVFVPGLGSHRAPKGRQFPGIDGRIELDRKKSELCHQGWLGKDVFSRDNTKCYFGEKIVADKNYLFSPFGGQFYTSGLLDSRLENRT